MACPHLPHGAHLAVNDYPHKNIHIECSGPCKKSLPCSEFHHSYGADRKRQFTSRCRSCRSEARFAGLFPDTVCIQCLGHRPLDKNNTCAKCNAENGFRQCSSCGGLLLLFLQFYGRKKICKICAAEQRKTKRLASEPAQS